MRYRFLLLGVFAVVISAVSVLPALPYFTHHTCLFSSSDSGLAGPDDLPFYMPRVTAFAKGGYGVGDPIYYEHKTDYVTSNDKLGTIISGFIQVLTRDALLTFVIARLIFLSTSVVMLVHFLRKLTNNTLGAMLGATLIVLTPEIFSTFSLPLSNVFSQFQFSTGAYIRRLPNSLITFPLLILYFESLFALYTSKFTSLKRVFVAGILVGVLSFTYFYFWSFALVSYVVITLFSLLGGAKPMAVRNALMGLVLSLLCSLPYVYSYYHEYTQALQLGGFNALYRMESLGVIRTHWNEGNVRSGVRMIFVGMVTFVLHSYRLRLKRSWVNHLLFLLGLYLSTELAFNSNIVLGMVMQVDHYMYTIGWAIINLFVICGFVYLCEKLHKKYFRLIHLMAAVMIVGTIGISLRTNLGVARSFSPNTFACNESVHGLVAFLKTLPQQSVVQPIPVDERLGEIILNHTAHFLFYYWSGYSTASFDELLERKAFAHKLVTPTSTVLDHSAEDGVVNSFTYAFKYNKDRRPPALFASLANLPLKNRAQWLGVLPAEIAEQYTSYLATLTIQKPPYRLDYVITNPQQAQTLISAEPKIFTQVFSNTGYVVLRYTD